MAEIGLIPRGLVRWSGAAWVALFLFWLPFEDVGVGNASGLAGLGALWLLARWAARVHWKAGWAWMGRGALLGGLAPIAVVALVAFKSGLHSHGFTDVPMVQLLGIVRSWPWWLAGGAGVGLAGWLMTKHRNAS